VIGIELAKELVETFIKAEFIKEEKYQKRVDKVRALEARGFPGGA
jgi:ribose 5-phosphate isomerase RpiB